jgi:penicillin-binding protein 1C
LNIRRSVRRLTAAALIFFFVLPACGFILLDLLFPFQTPAPEGRFAVTVLAEDGTPLRRFADDKGVWRYPTTVDAVSPLYFEALINYEDRWFRYHPGVNPVSLLRALKDYVKAGRPQTGGSTLSMQTARLFYPHTKTIRGKLYQIFRALQLDLHRSKDEILNLYINAAPFGGPIEGVQAASWAYLGKPPKELSHAEAALLAVLPQAPSRLRPDRHPARARRARDKVLDRLAAFGVWSPETAADAKMEPVKAVFHSQPLTAPLLARRLKPRAGGGMSGTVQTGIDYRLQRAVERIVAAAVGPMPEKTSAAALVVDNETLLVRTYVGSADFTDDARYGHVDMIQAYRSPGSALKPFLYAFALEEGLIHSESLLVDAPFTFSGYRPGNFTQNFSGPVAAAEALQRSLNIPAVDLLDRLGPKFFDARLRQGGLNLVFPPHAEPNLAMILGGVGTSLFDLVSAYTSLAGGGLAGKPRLTPDDPIVRRRMATPGAAWIIRRILSDVKRPDLPGGRLRMAAARKVAWKTGTSYGLRDAWTIGVTDRYTVGVWVGRPDGTPSPGQYGRITAAPLLFRIVDALPRGYAAPKPVPGTVDRTEICWPLGTPPEGPADPLCHQRRTAWILNSVVPPTLPDRMDDLWRINPLTLRINAATGRRLPPDCTADSVKTVQIARWPKAADPWLKPRIRRLTRIPRLDSACGRTFPRDPDTVRIVGIPDNAVIRSPGVRREPPTVPLEALGGRGRLYWLLNGELIAETRIGGAAIHRFHRPGRYRLTATDAAGNYDSISFLVRVGGG